MKHFLKIRDGIDVTPLAVALQLQPELWNSHQERREYSGSPHAGTSDIWVRYNDPKNLKDNYQDYTKEHDSVWHPAYYALPQLRPIIFDLMARVQAVRLGGILITKIPAGKSVTPHADTGWHPSYYNMKLYVPLAGNYQCVNRVEDEYVVMLPGEAWYFDNTKEHEVVNGGSDDRMTLIICMRCEK